MRRRKGDRGGSCEHGAEGWPVASVSRPGAGSPIEVQLSKEMQPEGYQRLMSIDGPDMMRHKKILMYFKDMTPRRGYL